MKDARKGKCLIIGIALSQYVYRMQPLEISDNIWVFTSALYQTTSTVIKTERSILLVDPNWLPGEINRIRDFAQRISSGHDLNLIFTHSDYDHIIGYGAFSPSTVIASEAFVLNPRKAEDVQRAIQFDHSHYIERPYPLSYPQVDTIIAEDGQSLIAGDTSLTFYIARGHTDEGMFIICEPQGVWIAGDYLSDVEFPLINGTPVKYRQTLSKVTAILHRHQIRFLIPGHGTVARSTQEILQRRDEGLQYLDDIEAFARDGIEFPESRYRSRYPFWDGIADWHRQNITHLMKSG